MAVRVDINGDGVFDKELNDPSVSLTQITDMTSDGKYDVDLRAQGSNAVVNGAVFGGGITNSGTGNFNDFLGIQNTGTEYGFNTDNSDAGSVNKGDGSNPYIKTSSNFTHAIHLSDIAITTINGVQYYDFRLDANEDNSTPTNQQISLDTFKLYASTDGTIGTLSALQALTPVYDMDLGGGANDISVLFTDAFSSGSGRSDLSVLIPVANFAGNNPTTTYLYLYSEFGFAGTDYHTDATFEEWRTQNAVALHGIKFSDHNGNGLIDGTDSTDHTGVGGITINLYQDINKNSVLDGPDQLLQTTVTDSNGNYTFYGIKTDTTYFVQETIPGGSIRTTGDYETITVSKSAGVGSTIQVDPIGNHFLTPHITLTKGATVDGDCADTVGELVHYTVAIHNDGELALSSVVVTDSLEGGAAVALGAHTGDANNNSLLDVGETWTYTYTHAVTQADIDSWGGDGDGTLDNVATVNADSARGTVTANDDASVDVCQNPALAIVKDGAVPGDCADTVGEKVTWTMLVSNAGNVTLSNIVVTDPGVDAGSLHYVSGDANTDGLLQLGETWTYTATHTVTQGDIDAGADLTNIAYADGKAVNTGEAATQVHDDASVDVCQNPAIDLTKYVMTDQSNGWQDANDPDGPIASTNTTVDFRVTLENTGNVTLTAITMSDSVIHTVGGVPGAPQAINYNDPTLQAWVDVNHDNTFENGEQWTTLDANHDGTLDSVTLAVGEKLNIYYSLTSLLGQHENTAVVVAHAATTGTSATDNDDANYYVLPSKECVGVGTPGFWANNGYVFWDGIAGNEAKHAGQPGFADGELLYAVDSNHDGTAGGAGDQAGLLIGDYNHDGVTNAGEDTIFISLTDAHTLINASQKQVQDGKYMLGRDLVATWLNYLANGGSEGDTSCIDRPGANDNGFNPQHFMNDAIDWLQQFASNQNGSTLQLNQTNNYHSGDTQAAFQINDPAVKTSLAAWGSAFQDIDHSAATIHSSLDGYNNSGVINGTEFCCDRDNADALFALAQIA